MSIDCAIVNIDKKEFFRPIDMGLRSDIRVVENVPSLFHIAIVHMLQGHKTWYGNRVGIVIDAGGPVALPYPTWDHIMARRDGWKNILPDVIGTLVLNHHPAFDELYGGTTRDLMQTFKRFVKNLEAEQKEEEDEQDEWDAHLPKALAEELDAAKKLYTKVSKHLKLEKRGR